MAKFLKIFREYFELFRVFAGIGSVTFGGGIAMLPILERELIKKRHWMTSGQMLDYFAIGQCTPGVIAVNVSTFIGYSRKGLPGACAATAGIVAPSIVVITLLAMFLNNFADIIWVQRALRGINVVVAVLLISAVWNFGKKTIFDLVTFGIGALAFVAMTVFNVPGVFIVLIAGVLGIVARYRRFRKENDSPEEPSDTNDEAQP